MLAVRTPTFVDPVVRDLNVRGKGHIDDFPHASQADATQMQLTAGTGDDPMLFDLGGNRQLSGAVILSRALFTRLVCFRWLLLRVRFDKARWRALALLQCLEAL